MATPPGDLPDFVHVGAIFFAAVMQGLTKLGPLHRQEFLDGFDQTIGAEVATLPESKSTVREQLLAIANQLPLATAELLDLQEENQP